MDDWLHGLVDTVLKGELFFMEPSSHPVSLPEKYGKYFSCHLIFIVEGFFTVCPDKLDIHRLYSLDLFDLPIGIEIVLASPYV